MDFLVDHSTIPPLTKLSITGYYIRLAGAEYITDNAFQLSNLIVINTELMDRNAHKALLNCAASSLGCGATFLLHTGCVADRFGIASNDACLILDDAHPPSSQ